MDQRIRDVRFTPTTKRTLVGPVSLQTKLQTNHATRTAQHTYKEGPQEKNLGLGRRLAAARHGPTRKS